MLSASLFFQPDISGLSHLASQSIPEVGPQLSQPTIQSQIRSARDRRSSFCPKTVQRSAPEDVVLSRRAQRIGPGAVAEKRGGVQRARRNPATETIPCA